MTPQAGPADLCEILKGMLFLDDDGTAEAVAKAKAILDRFKRENEAEWKAMLAIAGAISAILISCEPLAAKKAGRSSSSRGGSKTRSGRAAHIVRA